MTAYQNFPLDFTKRTLELVNEYKGDYEATLLVNCLLGLLIAPNEYEEIKEELRKENSNAKVWKDFIDKVENWEKCKAKEGKQKQRAANLMNFIKSIRNSLAHFYFEPIQEKRVKGFRFRDTNGFKVDLTNKEIKKLVQTLTPIAERAFRKNVQSDESAHKVFKERQHQTPIVFNESPTKFS